MWRAVWKIEAHKTLPWFFPILLVITGYALLRTNPLGSDDLVLAVLGGLQGWVLSFRLFSDRPGVAAFVFSRPLSRRRLLLYRWLIGLALQALAVLILLALLALGVREAVQTRIFRSAWYPMVRWHETGAIWPVGLVSLFFYQASCFVILRRRLIRCWRPRSASRIKRLATAVSGAFLGALLVVIFVGTGLLIEVRNAAGGMFGLNSAGILLFYLALLTTMTTLSALYCYRRLEVEA